MKKQLKILNLIDIPWYSGLTEYAIIQSEALKKYTHNIYFCIPKINPKFNELSLKFKTIEISNRKKILGFSEIIRILKFIKQNDIEILNAHTGRMQTLAYIISLIKPTIKIIRTKSDAQNIKNSITYSKVKTVICGSKYIENMYISKKIKSQVKTIYLSYHSVEPQKLPNKPYKITIIGRLDPVKGHNNFIKAAINLLKKRKDIKFIIAGKEANIKWNELKTQIPTEFEKYFNYLGYVNDVYELMGQSHIGIISSISSEAVSRVAIEWMNSARMIISSDVGCLPEIIDKDFIYPHNDWSLLASKINENLDMEKIANIGNKNKERFIKLFSFDRFAKLTSEAFENT